MILVGQLDSPFVRRVAVALNFYDLKFERRVLSVFQDFNSMLEINPLGKVPTLILDDGTHLYDSRAIIEYLELVSSTEHRLTSKDEKTLVEMLRIEAMGIGLAEKIYERGIEFSRRRPGTQDPAWIERLEQQIESVLGWLESQLTSDWFVGERMTRADIAVVIALTYLTEKLPQLSDKTKWPKLEGYRHHAENMTIFSAAAYSGTEAMATGWKSEQ
jgi:glutathione S-transferase